ncbi:hypothetical protein JKP88DRAFT_157272 [Tribonema minus]|uniref:PROP1-like PPR domain-containing protein n=1 Tax=Tribonema minus TaxID=303371 RepID=A0A835YWP6_9STRA|nr:hypothetical protein JKP88DRAFT_157272 [Tribonema minus]
MLERGIIPGPVDFLQLLGACSRNLRKLRAAGDTRGGSAQAMELLQLMEQPGVEKPDFKHYSAAINVCGKAGDWTSAVHIFEQMQLQGVHANISCWTALLDALGRAKKVDQMLATYREMLASGQEPDTVAFGTLLAHAGAAGESGIAEDIRREMQRLKIAPNTWTYCALTNCYAVTGEPEKAEAVLAEMRQSTMTKPSAIAYNRYVPSTCSCLRLLWDCLGGDVCFDCRTAWQWILQPTAKW